MDGWTDKASELSGETSGAADEIEQLLINMRRAKAIDPDVSRDLLDRYLNEKDADQRTHLI
ncbi:hypothetical protein [Pseudorhizobium flavum]|uniref:hypothetical protein n=1 Tax=Pseudorhizobium flavum TaxID=1335061 RepID=UPI00377063B8